ncbi:hypothetical protein MLD38_014381 [Melastoma candidum]|uniref:Uncharacterized protein n=1 Tax=Melastoma candidum TaxID=119954 RepID=A0ACB9RD50_9MYRT|nr:hypothetical protein MLD38_014381 [Melastoma candidum]
MDEPTSGLDARAAAVVMRTIRKTVDTGRAIVCTIHQPSVEIFESFDELFLLNYGGEEVYVGPLGQRSQVMVKYFENIPGVRKLGKNDNPATWVMEITSRSQEEILGVNFSDIYRASELYRKNKEQIEELNILSHGKQDNHFRGEVLEILLHPVESLPLETKQVLLAQCVVQCNEICSNHFRSSYVRHVVLGPWKEKAVKGRIG